MEALGDSWGGIAVADRKRKMDSPAYRLNHEEVAKALEEGIHFIENMVQQEAIADDFGAVAGLKCRRATGELVTLPARAVC